MLWLRNGHILLNPSGQVVNAATCCCDVACPSNCTSCTGFSQFTATFTGSYTSLNGTYVDNPSAPGSFQATCAFYPYASESITASLSCVSGYWELVVTSTGSIPGGGSIDYGMSVAASGCPPKTWNLTGANSLGGTNVGNITIVFN